MDDAFTMGIVKGGGDLAPDFDCERKWHFATGKTPAPL